MILIKNLNLNRKKWVRSWRSFYKCIFSFFGKHHYIIHFHYISGQVHWCCLIDIKHWKLFVYVLLGYGIVHIPVTSDRAAARGSNKAMSQGVKPEIHYFSLPSLIIIRPGAMHSCTRVLLYSSTFFQVLARTQYS